HRLHQGPHIVLPHGEEIRRWPLGKPPLEQLTADMPSSWALANTAARSLSSMLPSAQAIAISGTRASAATVALLLFSAASFSSTTSLLMPEAAASASFFRLVLSRSRSCCRSLSFSRAKNASSSATLESPRISLLTNTSFKDELHCSLRRQVAQRGQDDAGQHHHQTARPVAGGPFCC